MGLTIAQMGFIIEKRGNEEVLSALEGAFTTAGRRGRAFKLSKTAIALLRSLEKTLPGEYTVLFSIDAIEKIISDKAAVLEVTNEYLRDLAKKVGYRKYQKYFLPNYSIALHILRGLGLLEVFSKGDAKFIGLTKLGKVVKDHLESARLPYVKELSAMVLASLPFSTKMRVVYGLYYMYGPDYAGFYATLRDKLFARDPSTKLRYYDGVERLCLEILYEMVLTKAGGSEVYLSETYVLTKLLEGFLKLFSGDKSKMNELFRALNKYLRFPHHNRFPYESAAWEALVPGSYLDLDEALERYKLSSIRPLMERLHEEFASIEHQLRGLYGLPLSY
jgi:hypothetical protein